LEELVEAFIARHDTGAIEIVGGPGAGKTTAIAHLAEVLCTGNAVLYLDDASPKDILSALAIRLVVYTTGRRMSEIADVTFELSPWGEDEMIEFLLAMRPDRCQSVIARIRATADRPLLGGNPEIWRIAIERMADDESVRGPPEILRAELAARLLTLPIKQLAQDYALARMRGLDGLSSVQRARLATLGADDRLLRLLRHRVVHVMLATARLCKALACGDYGIFHHLQYELIRETAVAVRDSADGMERLFAMLGDTRPDLQSMAASILHATETGWMPVGPSAQSHMWQKVVHVARKLTARSGELPPSLPCLEGAQLAGAKWPGVELAGANISNANLAAADLNEATLANVNAVGCRLTRASLRKADLTAINFRHANLHKADCSGASMQNADLREADLTSARFRSAELCGADLRDAHIDGADFSSANFTAVKLDHLPLNKTILLGASFNSASLMRCDLEGMRLRRAQFMQANLSHALLTSSVMPMADFQKASLRGAGLADIQWERADLRGADLRTCSFFLGSSRSGLVGSPLASEGSRTGFYTDDFDEQGFKSPEEIRKANLRGADLRGAKIDGVDFYLVDLRNAKYTRKQGEQLRRCGAILSKHPAN